MAKLFLLTSLFALFFLGCRSAMESDIRLYLLEYPGETEYPADDIPDLNLTAEKSCKISFVEIHPAFGTHKIAIREGSHEIRYFSYNQWAVRPGQSLSLILTDFFRKSNLFEKIIPATEKGKADYTFETYIPRLEVVRNGKKYKAHIETEFRLINNHLGTTVLEQRSVNINELDERCLNLFSSEISSMFTRELHNFTLEIIDELTDTGLSK